MTRRFFTADTHFGHTKLIKYDNRPCATSEEMDEFLIHAWNATVLKSDIVYHCGDFAWRGNTLAKQILQRLNGQIHLIEGNHDALSKKVRNMFTSVSQMKRIKIGKQEIWLSHFPLKTWEHKGRGAWNIHGHCHGRLMDQECNSVDIGVGQWGWSPVAFETLQEYFKGIGECLKNGRENISPKKR